MRTSKDVYKLPDGTIVALSQDQAPPEGSVIWNGYDYRNQYWVLDGKRDTRTLEELRATLKFCYKCRTVPIGKYESECYDCRDKPAGVKPISEYKHLKFKI